MIETSIDKRVKISQLVEGQLPSYVVTESPLFVDFLKQYYQSGRQMVPMANSLALSWRAGTPSPLHSDLHRVHPTEGSPQRWPSVPGPRVPPTGLLRVLHLQTAPIRLPAPQSLRLRPKGSSGYYAEGLLRDALSVEKRGHRREVGKSEAKEPPMVTL